MMRPITNINCNKKTNINNVTVIENNNIISKGYLLC